MIGFSFFVILAFCFSQYKLIVFYIAGAFALAFRVIHPIYYVICFSFDHHYHLNNNMASFNEEYERMQTVKFPAFFP
ncbi:hypothetical protein PT2222_180177 [Paraburkholderia tropica]